MRKILKRAEVEQSAKREVGECIRRLMVQVLGPSDLTVGLRGLGERFPHSDAVVLRIDEEEEPHGEFDAITEIVVPMKELLSAIAYPPEVEPR